MTLSMSEAYTGNSCSGCDHLFSNQERAISVSDVKVRYWSPTPGGSVKINFFNGGRRVLYCQDCITKFYPDLNEVLND